MTGRRRPLALLYAAIVLFVVSIGLCLRAIWLIRVPSAGVSLPAQEMSAQVLMQLPDADIHNEMMATR